MPESIQDIVDLLGSRANAHGALPAIETESGKILTYANLYEKASHIGASLASVNLQTRRKRPRVGIVLPNGANFAVALLGVSFAGEAAPFFPGSTPSEFDLYFQSAGIDGLLVGADENGPVVAIAAKRGLPVLRLSADYRLVGYDPPSHEVARPDGDDVALVLMTSGSTGRAKLVPLSHRNVCISAGDVCRSLKLGPEDRCLSMWEQYHIGGLVDLLLAPLYSGGCIISTQGFGAGAFFENLRDKRPTWFQAVPTTLNELVDHASRYSISCDPNTLRLIRSVAAALAPSLMQKIETLFDVPVIQTFGMTEASPLITSTALPPAVRKPGSVGRSSRCEIRIVGPDGNTPENCAPGEVAIRGPNVFRGYEVDVEANGAAFRDGWFHTGDIGYIDPDGDLFLTGRIKQMINRGGEKVNPQEVDDALLEHPAVAESAAFSVKHKTLGEDVGAAVVLSQNVTTDELRGFLASKLSAFKIPGQIAILEQLPRNPVGKIDRLALARIAEATSAETGHVAPRNELEAFLAGLWTKELSVDLVGIHDDFSALGGDSLSSMRILIALDEALNKPVPEEIIVSFSTIAGLAKALSVAGLELNDTTKANVSSEAGLDAAVASILSGVKADGLGFHDTPGLAAEKLTIVKSRMDLTNLHDGMTVYATPAELAALLRETRGVVPGSAVRSQLRLLARFNSWRRQARWRRQIAAEIGSAAANSSWKRHAISESILVYSNGSPNQSEKTLLIGFTGNQLRLMMPTYRILDSLDPEKFDILLLSDPALVMFMEGIDGAGSNLDELCDFIERLAAESKFRRIVSFGTSGGGLAAVYAAVKLGWSKAVAVGAASPVRHPEFAAKLESLTLSNTSRATEIVAAFSVNSIDADAANQIKDIYPWTSVLPDRRFTNHNLLIELYEKGELAKFMTSVLKD